MVLRVYIPESPTVARKWLEEEIQYHNDKRDNIIVINDEFKSSTVSEYLKPFAHLIPEEVGEKYWYVYFLYPENGKTFKQIWEIVQFAVELSHHTWVYLVTVCDWVVEFLNVFIYLGEMTVSERKQLMDEFGIKTYIRFDDVKVEWLKLDGNGEIDYESVELVPSAPPQYSFIYQFDSDELNKMLVRFDIVYDQNRSEPDTSNNAN